MRRTPIVAGNWKMNRKIEDAVDLATQIRALGGFHSNVETVIIPPFIFLNKISKVLAGSSLGLGAQNVFWEDEGAYTGEISPGMLLNINCPYALIGHSERRQILGETNRMVNRKLKAVLAHRMTAIVCIGETLEQREGGDTFNHIKQQLREGLAGIKEVPTDQLVLAYEPIWAIGTGKVATPEQAQEMHKFIRQELDSILSSEQAGKIRILYGGSVKAENAGILIKLDDVDGFLIGGASLKADSFIKIEKEVYAYLKISI
ncbi:MAG: triose-phosphate isomerase [bacterium]